MCGDEAGPWTTLPSTSNSLLWQPQNTPLDETEPAAPCRNPGACKGHRMQALCVAADAHRFTGIAVRDPTAKSYALPAVTSPTLA